MKIESGYGLLLGASSVRLHCEAAEQGPELTAWLGSCGSNAFDVVGDDETPNPRHALQIKLKGATGMELLLSTLGLFEKSDIYAHIQYDGGEWVGYDEAGLEHTRDRSYLAVRHTMINYATALDVPLNVDSFPCTGDTWKHHNGNEYEILLLTNQYSNRPEYPPTVVYQGPNGKVWSKPLLNFLEKMTFVRRQEQVVCGEVEVPHLGITGIREGGVWPGDTAQDTTPVADIDIQFTKDSKRCAGSDHIWHGAIHVNGQTDEHARELRALIIEGLRAVTGKRDSLDFESLLAGYHQEVWSAAESEEDSRPGYDEAGLGLAKQLIAMYRGEATYTHHLDAPKAGPVDHEGEPFAQDQWWVTELDNASITKPISADLVRACRVAVNLVRATCPPITPEADDEEAKQRFIQAWGAVPPTPALITTLHENGEKIVDAAMDAQMAKAKKMRCPDCNEEGKQCMAGCSAHAPNWHTCTTCNGSMLVDAPEEPDPTGDHMFERFIKKGD